jgi:hypothetical protein
LLALPAGLPSGTVRRVGPVARATGRAVPGAGLAQGPETGGRSACPTRSRPRFRPIPSARS